MGYLVYYLTFILTFCMAYDYNWFCFLILTCDGYVGVFIYLVSYLTF